MQKNLPSKVVPMHRPVIQGRIDKVIKNILSRGKVVKFTNILSGTVKVLDNFERLPSGDFAAYYSTGKTLFVCPYSPEYDISEAERSEFPNHPPNG